MTEKVGIRETRERERERLKIKIHKPKQAVKEIGRASCRERV